MGVEDPGRRFSNVQALALAATGSSEVTLVTNDDPTGHLVVTFADMQLQTPDGAGALDDIELAFKDSTPTYYRIRLQDATGGDWQGSGMRFESKVAGADLVCRFSSTGAGEGQIMVCGMLL